MRIFILIPVILLLVVSCGKREQEEILVFAAASLTDVMERLGEQFAQEEEINVVFNFGGSVALAQQIKRGAPADIYLSAGTQPMDILQDDDRIVPDTRVDLLTNRLVLVGGLNNRKNLEINSIEDLTGIDARIAIADPDLAPAGSYAREALQNLSLWEQVKSRLVFGLDVRVALGYVESGNADLGIVYVTDTVVSDEMAVIDSFPETSHSPILYPAALVKRSSNREVAIRFLDFLEGVAARKIFHEHGFVTATE